MSDITITRNKKYVERNVLSTKVFNLILGVLVFYGFAANAILTLFFHKPIEQIYLVHPVLFLVVYFALAFLGIFMMVVSDKPIISFLGYNLLVLPIGLVVALVIPDYAFSSIIIACAITAICTLSMMIASMIYPNFFLKLGRPLFFALGIAILIELLLLIFGVHLQIWDFLVALIFCGYIGYDWAKINNKKPKTLDAAIDGAGELYLDIINLFLRILSIVGGKNSKRSSR